MAHFEDSISISVLQNLPTQSQVFFKQVVIFLL